MASDILIVDDESDICDLVSGILEDEGYEARTAMDSDAALAAVNERRPSLVILDIWLQGSRLDGLAVLDVIKGQHPDLPVVVFSGHGNIETAVAAIKRGAYDYVEKPFKTDRLLLIAARALEAMKLKREVKELRERSGEVDHLIGDSPLISQLRQYLKKVASTNSRILIVGPMGSGKEHVARTIHRMSNRAAGPFIALNAAAITPDGMEEELFGVEVGSGSRKKVGALEEAHGGTIYLDEIADMPRETQNKILRVLTEQKFTRVGGSTKVTVDIRIVSSSAKNMEEEVASGNFREDLFHRLGVVPLKVPGLTERREDIPDLVNHYVDHVARAAGIPKRVVSQEALAVLQAHDWPGNVRQLKNNVERLMILARGEPEAEITIDLLPAEMVTIVPALPSSAGGERLMSMKLREARDTFERDYLLAQLTRFGGNISKTAKFVGMERSALHRKLKAVGLPRPEFDATGT